MKQKQVTKLHKYYKRMLATMSGAARHDFKNLMLGAVQSEKNHKENTRKNKEKDQKD